MRKFFEDKWNPILLVLVIVLIVELIAVYLQPSRGCYESLDVTKGQNFNQPILTWHNCGGDGILNNSQNF